MLLEGWQAVPLPRCVENTLAAQAAWRAGRQVRSAAGAGSRLPIRDNCLGLACCNAAAFCICAAQGTQLSCRTMAAEGSGPARKQSWQLLRWQQYMTFQLPTLLILL